MTEPLPDLLTKLKGDVSDLIAALAEAKAAMKEYQNESGKTADKVKADSDKETQAAKDFARLVPANISVGRTALQGLQQEYDKTGAKVDQLRTKFAQTGDVTVFGDLKKAEADLSTLKGYLTDAGQKVGSDAGEKAGENFIQKFGGMMSNLPLMPQNPYVAAALGGLGIAMAPAILAALDGALAAGIGAGGIAVGIAAAAKQPEVAAAFLGLKNEAGSVFSDIGKEFADPVTAGIGDIDKMLQAAAPGLKSAFGELASSARPLIDGFGGFVDRMLPGLEDAFRNAAPFVQQLASDLPQLGADIGTMFDDFTKGGPGAVDALNDLIITVGDLAKGIGLVAEYSGKFFRDEEIAVDILDMHWADLIKHIIDGNDGIGSLTPAMSQFGKEAEDVGQNLDALNTAFQTFIGLSESTDQALLADKTALTNLHKEIKDGKKYWDENTAAGQKNVGLLLAATKGMTDYYTTLESGQTNGATKAQLQAELDEATNLYNIAKQAGATGPELATLKGIVDGLTASLKKVPADVPVNVHISVTGQSQLSKVQNTLSRLGGGQNYANSGVAGSEQIPHFASSGVYDGMATGGIYKTAENGPEANIAKYGDRNRALSTLAEAAGWFAGDINRSVGVGISAGSNGAPSGTPVILTLDGRAVGRGLIPPVNRMNGRSSVSIYSNTVSGIR